MGRKMWGVMIIFGLVCSCAITAGSDLEEMKENQITKLEVVEDKILPLLEALESKQVNQEMSDQLQQTQQEITELIIQQQDALAEATTVAEVREVMEETKDRVILKTYDGITARETLEEIIQVEGGVKEQQQAVDAVLHVIGKKQTRSLQIVTTQTLDEVMTFLHTFDAQAIIEELFADGENLYLQITFDETSVLKQELFTELDEGVLPEYFLGYRIIKPEVYTIGQVSLSGEQALLLWGQMRRETSRYHDGLKNLPKVRVGVVDTGIDPTHPDLVHALSSTTSGYDFVNSDADPFDDHLHGTHVAGTIAAAVNGRGVFGVNPFVEIVPLKICTKTGYCPSYAITNALVYAADQGIEVLNMSLGGAGTLLNNPTCAAIEYATNKGSIAVVAAGNANSSASTFIPAACSHTITVGAVNKNLQRASFSNYGPHVDISAPGVDIYSTIPGGERKSLDGTSMATPHVSAAVATVLAKQGTMSTTAMQQNLLSFTKPVTYETGKPIGPFLDYGALMAGVGIVAPGCGGAGCTEAFLGTGIYTGVDVQVQHLQEFSSSHTGVLVTAGKTVLVDVFGGTPPYRISKENNAIGLARKDVRLSPGIQIANNTSDPFVFVGADEAVYSLPGDDLGLSDEVIINDPSVFNLLGDEVDIEAVHIASTEKFSFRVLGLHPGKSTITVTDAVGKIFELPVDVEEQVIHLLPYQYLRLPSNEVYSLLNIAEAQLSGVVLQQVVKVYAGGSVAVSKVVYNIYNRHEKKHQTLALSFVVGTQEHVDEYKQVQHENSLDPYPLFVDKTYIDIEVGQEAFVSITGGRAGYSVEKGTGSIVGLGQVRGDVVLGGSIRVLGLSPGSTTLTVRDIFGRKKQVTVVVKEKTFWVKPGEKNLLGGNNTLWRTTKVIADSLATTTFYHEGKWYVRGGNQEGFGILRHRIFNNAEQEEQEFVYTLRVGWTLAKEPLTTSFEEITLNVGQVAVLRMSGGIPSYTINKSAPHIGFAVYKGAGTMSIASVGVPISDEAQDPIVVATDGDQPIEQDTPMDETDEGPAFSGTLLSPQILDQIDIASTQTQYNIYVIGLTPGVSTVTITDHEGIQKQVKFTVLETILSGALGTEKGWYYQNPYRMYEVRGMRIDHPSLVKPTYRNRTYSYTMLHDGITSLTLDLWNPLEKKNQEMRYTLRSGTPSTMDISIDKERISIGEVAIVTLTGGLGPYTLTKSNEAVGLGYAQSDLTTIATLPDAQKIHLPYGSDLPVQGGGDDGGVNDDEVYVTGWTDEDWRIFNEQETHQTSLHISSLSTGTNSQSFRVVGLTSGVTTLTVKDVFGEVKTISVVVEPRQISLTSAYSGGYFRAPYNPKHLLRFMNSKPVASGNSRWSVTALRPSVSEVVGRFRRGPVRQYYLYGIANGTTDLFVDMYNPHERKHQTLTYQVATTGMVYADLVKLLAFYEIKRQNNGPASSINPGGGGFPSPALPVSQAPEIHILKEEETILGKVVHIKLTGGSGKYQLTLDRGVHFIDASLQVAAVEVSDEDVVGDELPTFQSEEIDPGVEVNAVTINKTYTISVDANRTYSLIVNNSSLLIAKDLQKNLTTSKQLTSSSLYSSYTYTAIRGSAIDLPVHDSYLFASENNSVMSIVKKITSGYRISFLKTGGTKLKVIYINPITGRKTEVRIDVKVVEKGVLPPPISTGPQIIEKTIYLDPTKEYSLFLEDGKRYEIEHNGLLGFYTPSEYMYAMNEQGVSLASNTWKLLVNKSIKNSGIRILKGQGTNKTFSITNELFKYLIHVNYSDGARSNLNYTFPDGSSILISELQLSIEDKINIIFSTAYEELVNASPGERLSLLQLRFGDNPNSFDRNLKKSLYYNNYISEEGGDILLYGLNIPSPDLGNLLYGYLTESVGMFDFAVDVAFEIERLNYVGYYPDDLVLLRSKLDEDSDTPWYDLGKQLFLNQDIGLFGNLIKAAISEGLEITEPLKDQQEDGIKDICMKTHMQLVTKFIVNRF